MSIITKYNILFYIQIDIDITYKRTIKDVYYNKKQILKPLLSKAAVYPGIFQMS